MGSSIANLLVWEKSRVKIINYMHFIGKISLQKYVLSNYFIMYLYHFLILCVQFRVKFLFFNYFIFANFQVILFFRLA